MPQNTALITAGFTTINAVYQPIGTITVAHSLSSSSSAVSIVQIHKKQFTIYLIQLLCGSVGPSG